MMKQILRVVFILGVSFLSLATVVKKKDPITETQTDPIAYKEKEKEEKEGKKGPPVPTLELFPRLRFLSEGPVKGDKKSTPAAERETAASTIAENEDKEIEEEASEWDEFKVDEEGDDTSEDRKGPFLT